MPATAFPGYHGNDQIKGIACENGETCHITFDEADRESVSLCNQTIPDQLAG